MKRNDRWPLLLAALLALGACSSDGGNDVNGDGDGDGDGADAGADIASYTVTGSAVDFATGETLDSATITTDGITPPPTVSVTGADFEIANVPPGSVFYLLAGSPPEYLDTYSAAIEVGEADLDDVVAGVVSEDYLAGLAEAFGVEPQDGTGVLIARAVDDAGEPVADLPAAAFQLDGGPATGPFFLDENREPDPALEATSASGYVVYVDVEPGEVAITAAEGSDYTMTMASSPVASATATLGVVAITEGDTPLPMNVSFSDDIVPIFAMRGCTACHSGGGIGKDLGGLVLDGGENRIYKELTEELSPNDNILRVDLEMPADSLLLRMPSREDPPDRHPNSTFASPQDPDYLLILAWISEGALQN